jgi:hypothetical protein
MPRRLDARALLFEKIRTSPPKFVHVTGVPYFVEREPETDDAKVDHVWITLEVPPFGRVRIVINTVSLLSRDAGGDPRMRVAILSSAWIEKPAPTLVEEPGQDYAKIEKTTKVGYADIERDALAELLMERAKKAVRAEVWGDLYARDHLGVHQVHSRRASSAVATDIKNRDGALKLYYAEDNLAELFLFKFSGQP